MDGPTEGRPTETPFYKQVPLGTTMRPGSRLMVAEEEEKEVVVVCCGGGQY